MGLISFVKNAGKKLFNRDDKDEDKVVAIRNYLNSFNLGAKEVHASFDGEDTVTLKGTTDSLIERRRIVATIGNIDGVEKVNDHIRVNDQEPDKEKEVQGFYEVKSGDTLSAIAQSVYGDASKYPQIFKANQPMLKDPDEIYPGQKLVIPREE